MHETWRRGWGKYEDGLPEPPFRREPRGVSLLLSAEVSLLNRHQTGEESGFVSPSVWLRDSGSPLHWWDRSTWNTSAPRGTGFMRTRGLSGGKDKQTPTATVWLLPIFFFWNKEMKQKNLKREVVFLWNVRKVNLLSLERFLWNLCSKESAAMWLSAFANYLNNFGMKINLTLGICQKCQLLLFQR